VATFKPGVAYAVAHALNGQVAFKLGDRADDDEHGPTERPAGVEVVTEPHTWKMPFTSIFDES
jgi:hypothetical protein